VERLVETVPAPDLGDPEEAIDHVLTASPSEMPAVEGPFTTPVGPETKPKFSQPASLEPASEPQLPQSSPEVPAVQVHLQGYNSCKKKRNNLFWRRNVTAKQDVSSVLL